MLVYVSHCHNNDPENVERARRITHDLQVENPTHCFICPLLMFSHLQYGEIGYDEEIELCLDIISVCDQFLITSEISEGVRRELDFARLVGMEVIDLAEKIPSDIICQGLNCNTSLTSGFLTNGTG